MGLSGLKPGSRQGCLLSSGPRGKSIPCLSPSIGCLCSLARGPLPPSSKPARAGHVFLTLRLSGVLSPASLFHIYRTLK